MLSTEIISSRDSEVYAMEAFKEFRLKKGIVCKKCQHTQHYWLNSKQQFQCKKCRFRTTLRSGTLLEGSKLPLSYFFIALELLDKRGSVLRTEELKEHTNHKYYEPLYDFLRKIKTYMRDHEGDNIVSLGLEVSNKFRLTYQDIASI